LSLQNYDQGVEIAPNQSGRAPLFQPRPLGCG
jgi:hypothetical protein